ncbi:aspartic proteinase CDR1-like [Impatiens glandulifera]|uniref:aspartic proteinase CDR1-like n=1 Tax=Impatiens glandulifera TaxID=253017 RepID=UPI001FB118B0|nr:aspartic proteinase CDR1-like [Impatiens glandulifera]
MRSDWDYLMEIYIGTPPVKQLAIADTGNEITWTQCQPCLNCYRQNQPIFNPMESSSYKVLSCSSSECQNKRQDLISINCDPRNSNSKCDYGITYDDGSTTNGVLGYEMYKLGHGYILKMAYGCAYDNRGNYHDTSAGIVGLGNGDLSFVGQIRKLIGGKFSYCLVHWSKLNEKSQINFGANAIMSGRGVVSTRLVRKSPRAWYHVTLEAVSIGNTRIPFNNNVIEAGNIVMDSGTMPTRLPMDMYQKLENAIRSVIRARPVQDPSGEMSLCYKKVDNFRIPTIIYHFAGGADVVSETDNTIIPLEGILCLAILPSINNLAIYGSLSQMNQLIGYDLEKNKVYFKPTIC